MNLILPEPIFPVPTRFNVVQVGYPYCDPVTRFQWRLMAGVHVELMLVALVLVRNQLVPAPLPFVLATFLILARLIVLPFGLLFTTGAGFGLRPNAGGKSGSVQKSNVIPHFFLNALTGTMSILPGVVMSFEATLPPPTLTVTCPYLDVAPDGRM